MPTFNGIPQIGATQVTNAGTTSNDADAYQVDSNNAVRAETVDNTNAFTITNATPTWRWEKNKTWRFTDAASAPTAQIALTVPASPARGEFVVLNKTGQDMAVAISGQPLTAPLVPAGEGAVLTSDGANVELASSGGGGAAAFLDLTDTPASYSGQGEKYVQVNPGATALQFAAAAPGSPGAPLVDPVRGCRLDLSADVTGVDATSAFDIPFDQELFDTDAFHDNVTNNERITIPAKYDGFRADLLVACQFTDFTADTWASMTVRHFDSADTLLETWGIQRMEAGQATFVILSAAAQNVLLATGDYFVATLFVESDTSLTIVSSSSGIRRTSFGLRIVDREAEKDPVAHWENGTPAAASTIFRKIAERRFSLDDDFAGSKAKFATAPSGGAVALDVKVDGTKIGEIDFADGVATATFTTTGTTEEPVEIGEELTIETPANLFSAADLVISLFAWRS